MGLLIRFVHYAGCHAFYMGCACIHRPQAWLPAIFVKPGVLRELPVVLAWTALSQGLSVVYRLAMFKSSGVWN